MIPFRIVMGTLPDICYKGTVESDRLDNLEPFISCDDGVFTRYLYTREPVFTVTYTLINFNSEKKNVKTFFMWRESSASPHHLFVQKHPFFLLYTNCFSSRWHTNPSPDPTQSNTPSYLAAAATKGTTDMTTRHGPYTHSSPRPAWPPNPCTPSPQPLPLLKPQFVTGFLRGAFLSAPNTGPQVTPSAPPAPSPSPADP